MNNGPNHQKILNDNDSISEEFVRSISPLSELEARNFTGRFGGRVFFSKKAPYPSLTLKSGQITHSWNYPLQNFASPATGLTDGSLIALDVENNQPVKITLLHACSNDPKKPFFQRTLDYHTLLKTTREFFETEGFLEAWTPSLVPLPAYESTLAAIPVTNHLFLPTSPEIHLKKQLCLNADRIYEIKTCYRNEPPSQWHSQEFLMLEWYRTFSPLDSIRSDVTHLIHRLHHTLNSKKPKPSVARLSLKDLFEKFYHLKDYQNQPKEKLVQTCVTNKIHAPPDEPWTDLFSRLLIERIEPAIIEASKNNIIYVYDYPATQTTLAKKTPDGLSERFEVFYGGLEIGNAFYEETNLNENLHRITEGIKEQNKRTCRPWSLDTEYQQALTFWGLPPSSGIAIGLERLAAVLTEQTDLQALRSLV